MKTIDHNLLDRLTRQAEASPRRRMNHNLHTDLADPVQRLAIAMPPDTYIRPHRHDATWELLTPLRGRFVVLGFDDAGRVTERHVLGTDTAVCETPAGGWHAVLSLDAEGVILEVKQGPYRPAVEADFAAWAPAAGDAACARLMSWYAGAAVGERWGAADSQADRQSGRRPRG
jgi:cupin fold WbuC family metalloprotein